MTIQFRGRQPATPATKGIPLATVAYGFWSRMLAQPGLLLKRLVLAVGGVYFTMVAVTNAVNFIASVGDFHGTFLNSGNVAYIASVTKVYSWPAWTADAAVLMAALAEGFGACLFGRALLRFRGRTAGIQAVWLALGWNIAVWLGFIAGTEFFVAYKSEGPFRELLVIALLMPVIIAVVPDRIAADDADREVPSGAHGKMPGKATTIAPSRLVSSLPEPGGSRSI